MPLYAKIDREDRSILKFRNLDRPRLADDPRKPKWVPVTTRPQPPFDDATEKLVRGEEVSLTGVTITWTVTPLTKQERDRADAEALAGSGKDSALVLVELIDWLLANTAIKPADFTPNVRQAYQRLKARVDRAK